MVSFRAPPILLKRGVPCTFFVTTDWIDNRTMFHRNKASLCVEAALGLSGRATAAFLRDLERLLRRPLPDPDAFRRWILGLAPHEEHRIDDVCSILGIDVASYLRERRPYLSADQIRRLAADGFTMGAHAKRHVPLGSLSGSALEEEIVGSCQAIRALTGQDRVPFAFPHSADGVDRAFLRQVVATHSIVGRLFDTHQLRRDDGSILNRIIVDAPPTVAQSTNLPQLLRSAYRAEATDSLRRLSTRGPWGSSRGINPDHPEQG
ncbi:MAG: hypothetical protein AUI47_09950 [Acidobacteria bacterium 13_1_40CM_2_68_5]|nr:MAG: hypothetical protein AUI47_09950 [Acidobacteria bacterium 13_1_40CM_2_68_5]